MRDSLASCFEMYVFPHAGGEVTRIIFFIVCMSSFPVESKKITPSIIENLGKNCKRKDGCAREKIVL